MGLMPFSSADNKTPMGSGPGGGPRGNTSPWRLAPDQPARKPQAPAGKHGPLCIREPFEGQHYCWCNCPRCWIAYGPRTGVCICSACTCHYSGAGN